MESIRLLIKALRRDTRGVRAGIAANIACGMAAVALSLAAVWLTREIVDAAVSAQMSRLNTLSILLCAALALRILASKGAQRFEAWSLTRFSNRMRARLFTMIMTGRLNADQRMHTADIVNRLSADVGGLSSAICSTLPALAISAASLAGAFAFLASIAPGIAVIVTLLMPMAIAIGKASVKKSHRLTKEIRQTEGEIVKIMHEDISHRTLVATLGYTDEAAEQFRRGQSRFFSLTMRRNDLGLYAGAMAAVGFAAGYAVIFLYCAFGLAGSAVSFATMTALLQLVAMAQRPAVDISHKFSPLVKASVAAARLNEIRESYDGKPGADIPACAGDCIRFEHVWVKYGKEDNYALADFTEDIPCGKTTTICGPTGAGKTTLFKLLLCICSPTRGRISSPFPISIGNVVYVPQGNSLMSGTIMSNLLMGKPDAAPAEIGEALHTACAAFAYDFPNGLQTRCGENGDGISEGQAQRIAIARGLLRLKAIRASGIEHALILLDEPTSALDAATEQTLCRRLRAHLKGQTALIITHKTAPAALSDRTINL